MVWDKNKPCNHIYIIIIFPGSVNKSHTTDSVPHVSDSGTIAIISIAIIAGLIGVIAVVCFTNSTLNKYFLSNFFRAGRVFDLQTLHASQYDIDELRQPCIQKNDGRSVFSRKEHIPAYADVPQYCWRRGKSTHFRL